MFYAQLQRLCKDNGEKITPLLIKLNMSTGNIEKWRNGKMPNGDTLIKLADYFDCSLDYLVGRSDIKERR